MGSRARVLIVEDDPRTSESIALYLRHAGYEATIAGDGSDALDKAASLRPDLVVLDLMLPGVAGLEVCRTLRQASGVPIVMLTARSTEDDTLHGLEAGADDYVTKPFSPRELVARITAVLRRARPPAEILRVSDVEIDLGRRRVRRGDDEILVTPAEFKLLEVLASAPGRAFSRAEIATRAFGHDHDALERTIDVHVMNLRRKLDAGRRPSVIVTVFGTGYRLGDPQDDA